MFSEKVNRPRVISPARQIAFEQECRSMGKDPSNVWIGGYVDDKWDHLRLVLESYRIDPKKLNILEFGCNVGASAIVFAHLGARVYAIDIADEWMSLARLNAERYGIHDINFVCIPDTRILPFSDQQFDLVNCGSVLEYIEYRQVAAVQREIDRVVKPDGIILVGGTSNRLWPREVHSGKWLVNYLPRVFDCLWGRTLERGVSPLSIRYGFGNHYKNLDSADKGQAFLESRLRMGANPRALQALICFASWLGVGPGMLAPNISCVLRKANSRYCD